MPEQNSGNQKFQAASWWKVLLNTFLFLLACFIGGIIYLFILSRDLPSIAELQRFNPEQVSKILSSDAIVSKSYTSINGMLSISAKFLEVYGMDFSQWKTETFLSIPV